MPAAQILAYVTKRETHTRIRSRTCPQLFPSLITLAIMATVNLEKALATEAEHLEDSKDSRDFIGLAEGVKYGYSGARAFLTSPNVFGAALLASMGGFSYGYGVY